MVGTIWIADIVVGSLSAVFLAVLLFIYSRNLRELRSPFTIGLFVFALFFLAQSLLGVSSALWMASMGYGSGVATQLLILHTVQAAAFGILVFISWD